MGHSCYYILHLETGFLGMSKNMISNIKSSTKLEFAKIFTFFKSNSLMAPTRRKQCDSLKFHCNLRSGHAAIALYYSRHSGPIKLQSKD